MVKVLIKKLDPAVEIPAYKTTGSSGMDLMAFIKNPIKLEPKTSCLIPTGLSVAFSEEYELQIRPRSGLAAKNDIIENAQKKLIEKNCDWIIANDVSDKSIGFNSDYNEVTIFYKDKKLYNENLSMKKKSEISEEIVNKVVNQLN